MLAFGERSEPRQVYLSRLRPPDDRQPGPLTDREILGLTKKGVLRSSHYLWLAEQYMMDMAKLGQDEQLDEKLAQLGEVCRYVEAIMSHLLRS